MFGRNYGAINAFADIIGAALQKRQQDGLWRDAAKYTDQINNTDLGGNVSVQDNTPMGLGVKQNTIQNTMPSTDFIGQQQPQQPKPGLLGNYNFAQNAGQQQPQATQEQYDQQAAFDQTRKENPQWFRQGTQADSSVYVGDRPDIDQNAVVDANGQVTGTRSNNYSFDNPIAKQRQDAQNNSTVTVSAPKSLTEAKQAVMSQMPQAMKYFAQKYGVENMKQIMPMLQQAANDKVTGYQQQYTQNAINSSLSALNSKDATERDAAKVAYQLTSLGVKVPNGFIQAFKNPELKHVVVNAGGQQVLKSFDPKTGKFTDGGSIDVTMNPYQQGQLSLKEREISDREQGVGGYGHAPRGSGSGGRSSTEKINGMTQTQAMNEVSRLKEWQKKNPDANIEDYPRYDQYMAAADPYGNYAQADNIVNMIKQNNPGTDDEDTFRYLYDRLGYGQGG